MSYETLQAYWWIIVSLLAALFVFLMFVQGGQTLLKQLSKTDMERSLLVNSIGRKWDLTFTTLVTFGGAFFASFPLFYSTSFGGAYWVWTLILFSFIIQAVSYEYRTKASNFLGRKTYDTFLFINGVLAPVLVGAAVGTFFTGSAFSVDRMNITNIADPVISRWETATHGLEAALNITNLSLGLALLFLSRVLAMLYFINNIDNENIIKRSAKKLKLCSSAFLVFFLLFVGLILTKEGFAVDPDTKLVFMEKFKYLHNLIEMPIVLVLFLIGVVGVLYGIFLGAFKTSPKGIWFAGTGTVLTVLAVLMLAGFNNTAFYPSTFDLQSSLTIENASSSKYTLTAMSWVSLLVPVVIAYIWYAWKSLSKNKVSEADIENDSMKY
ncbi:MAG: cytochrome d ubiquinol oxidase subunit II [Prolixibacteraceae bacterium]|nr:cytochrome d ubiquinol oxidase subunit II [Prolixibacteraceae bacterium]MBT6005436.1 cytochrome d ubiquinol oxidase subunit II [Prolixibacteraceae bacterium]MBT7000198.1 cytochrome d ubiquinol oxidase subunit II [Prolixibacteraceae bacterium]MBT7393803.1 cytochrome d ubiquinol oxidase subunit II [Prolixibacteraceae bacterium]